MATSTAEDYLKAILLRTSDAGGLVAMGDIASSMGVVPGTATTMIKTLAEQGLIEHTPRHGVRLTEAGRREATLVLRKHRIIETFLVSVLKMDWSEVHVEAERMEHAVSERVLNKIDAFLGYPRTDPHGDPIPDAAGCYNSYKTEGLDRVPLNTTVTIVRILDQSSGFLQFAENVGLVPGGVVTLVDRNETAGVLSVRVGGRDALVMGLNQGRLVLVAVPEQ